MNEASTQSLVKVFFELDDSDWHGYGSESVWAEPISSDRYRLRNTPLFAKGVSFEDVVFVKETEDGFLYKSTSIAAGHSTYRILFDKQVSNDEFQKYWSPLQDLGCTYESADRGAMILFAVDVPPSTDIHEAYRLLNEGEEDGCWGFEEGHCGHTV